MEKKKVEALPFASILGALMVATPPVAVLAFMLYAFVTTVPWWATAGIASFIIGWCLIAIDYKPEPFRASTDPNALDYPGTPESRRQTREALRGMGWHVEEPKEDS